MTLDEGNELSGLEGLTQVSRRSRPPAAPAIDDSIVSAEQDNGDVMELWVLSQSVADLVPIQARQHDVQ